MQLDPQACYEAIRTHDARFDGRFFVGVSSTGIYCRPVCRVRTPKPAHCSFFPSAAAAEAKGFRPCLRCRPEQAPGWSTTDASAVLARTAAALIERGAEQMPSIARLAQRLGVTDRHLRRIFNAEFGVSPVQYAQTQRLLSAKRLLTDTAMPVSDVAFASGFSSVRRMNALFSARYGFAPSRLRQQAGGNAVQPGQALSFALGYRPPYNWTAFLQFMARRVIPGVETVDDEAYRRIVRVRRPGDGEPCVGWLQVTHLPARNALLIMLSPTLSPVVNTVLAHVKRVFDLGVEPGEVSQRLGELAAPTPGLRLPGTFDGFELAMRAVLGQQVTVQAARTLASRFCEAFGESVAFEAAPPFAGVNRVFPPPAAVARLSQDDIARLGIAAKRANAMIAIAQRLEQGELDLSAEADVMKTIAQLQTIPGIGPWTAHYIAMRALSWPDAWPPNDVALLNALGLPNTAQGQRSADALAEAWRPWRSYAVLHAWRRLAALPAKKKKDSKDDSL